ncbi:MAG: polysaccharide deacetylase [Agathobacter sp.]|nr:polysaccharide deacetylase [Agathobacter sp.]
MATNDADLLNQQRQRRKRVNRIKNGIVWTIAMWMLFSLLAIIILSVQVFQLNDRLGKLETGGVVACPNSSETETNGKGNESEEDSGLPSESETGSENNTEEDRFANIITGIDTPENMAAEGDARYVYLTFNSVPSDNTEDILDILAQYQVKATFFVVGSEDDGDNAIYQRIVNEGHTIGMHSYSNQYSLIYSSIDAFKQDYIKISDFLYELTGMRSKFYRFPGGSGNQISNVNMAEFADILNQEQITYFDWNVSAGDTTSSYTKEDVLNNVLEGVSKYKTSVVLLHDGENKSTTVETLGSLIEQLKQQGAHILPIDENTNVIQYIHADSIGTE